MDKVTQSTAAAAEQSASASEEMSAQAQSLAHIVRELRAMAG
jgi:methyl-accepting chemotaxis protein